MNRTGTSSFLLALFLFVQALAISPALHAWFHPNAADADHECAITLLSHGQVEMADAAPLVFIEPVRFVFTQPEPAPVFASADVILLPNRGPPTALASV